MKLDRLTLISVLTDTPKMQYQIKKELEDLGYKTTERHIRTLIKESNEMFINGLVDYVIISNYKGCYISRNEHDIRKYNELKKNHALSELYMSYNVNKRIDKNKNMSFEEFVGGLNG